jgi:hypothetical protein
MWTTCPPTLSTLWWPEHLSRRTWEFLGSFAHPHFRCGLIAHPRSCWKLPYSAVWIKVVNVAIPWSLLFTNILMQYRICEKSPNSKIYNKLLFVCGDEKNQKWVIQTSPYFFYKLVSKIELNWIHDVKDVKYDSKKNGKRVLLAQLCHEQPMLQTYMGLPDGKL